MRSSHLRFERLDRIHEQPLLEMAEEFRDEGDDRLGALGSISERHRMTDRSAFGRAQDEWESRWTLSGGGESGRAAGIEVSDAKRLGTRVGASWTGSHSARSSIRVNRRLFFESTYKGPGQP